MQSGTLGTFLITNMDIAVDDIVVRCAECSVGTVTNVLPNQITITWADLGEKTYPEPILIQMFQKEKWMIRRGNTRLHY